MKATDVPGPKRRSGGHRSPDGWRPEYERPGSTPKLEATKRKVRR